MLNKDYKEMLQILLDNQVEFLVVGAYAMGAYGYPRATGDFDIWVLTGVENSRKIYKSLGRFGAPLEQIAENAFAEDGVIFQIGVAPRRIDIITHIDGVEFQQAFKRAEIIEIDALEVPFICKEDLIRNKESTGREKDRLDARVLRSNDES